MHCLLRGTVDSPLLSPLSKLVEVNMLMTLTGSNRASQERSCHRSNEANKSKAAFYG